MKYASLIVAVALLFSCGSKKSSGDEPQGEIPTEKPTQDPLNTVDKPTEDWLQDQVSVYVNSKIENVHGEYEKVRIDKETRRVQYTYYRDVSKIDGSISESNFCRYEVSGTLKKVRQETVVENHTEKTTYFLDMMVDHIERIDESNGSDREVCSLFARNYFDRLPQLETGVEFYYEAKTPELAPTLRRGAGVLSDPLFNFEHLSTRNQSPALEKWDLEFEVNFAGGRDYFDARPVEGSPSRGEIYDLGDTSCTNVGIKTVRRYKSPYHWLVTNVIDHPDYVDGVPHQYYREVKVGHCYYLRVDDAYSSLDVMFRVRNHQQGVRAVLHEIEIFRMIKN